jgi:hypothetical protein
VGWLSQRRIKKTREKKLATPGGKTWHPSRGRAHLERAVANRVEAVLGEGLEDGVDG